MLLNIIVFGCIAFLLLLLLHKLYGNELLHPVFISSIYWIGLIGFTVAISYSFDLNFIWIGLIPVFAFWLSAAIGSFYVDRHMRHKAIQAEIAISITKPLKRLSWIIVLFSIFGCMACYAELSYVGLYFHSISEFFGVSNAIYEMHTTGISVMPAYGQILIACLFASGFLAGFYFKLVKSWQLKLLAIFPFIPALLFTLINSAKSFLLQFLMIWISSYFSGLIYQNKGRIKLFKPKVLLSVGIIGIALMMIVPVMQSARYEKYSEETSVFGSKTLAYYSSVNAFTVWWAENDTIKCEPLKYTFSGLHNVIFKDREVGLYKSKTLIGTKNSKEIETNVYTILRGLIEDYTYPGAILLMCLVGFFYTLIYYKVKQGNILLFPLLSAFMAILLHSVLVSLFNFNVILIGWVIAFILVVFIFKITIPKTHE